MTKIQKVEENKLDKNYFNQKQVDLIRKTVAINLTLDEFKLFVYVAAKHKLDPLANQICAVKRTTKQGDVMTIQTRIDGFRAIAERKGGLAGMDDAIYDDGKKYEPGKEPKNPSKATITVYRMIGGQKVGFTASARWKEYYPGARQGFMWDKMPYNQLAKCAEALALRKAFPSDLSGLYAEEEMDQERGRIKVENFTEKAPVEKPKPQKQPEAPQEEEKPKNQAVEAEWTEDEQLPNGVYLCKDCDAQITEAENNYSNRLFGRPLCREDQKGAKRLNI